MGALAVEAMAAVAENTAGRQVATQEATTGVVAEVGPAVVALATAQQTEHRSSPPQRSWGRRSRALHSLRRLQVSGHRRSDQSTPLSTRQWGKGRAAMETGPVPQAVAVLVVEAAAAVAVVDAMAGTLVTLAAQTEVVAQEAAATDCSESMPRTLHTLPAVEAPTGRTTHTPMEVCYSQLAAQVATQAAEVQDQVDQSAEEA